MHSSLRRIFQLLPLTLGILLIGATEGRAADEESTVLTITGNLIDRIESLPDNSSPMQIITNYYQHLSEQKKENLLQLKTNLDRRVADYNVAYTAADTAEINEIFDELSFNWASIRTLHAHEFTEAAINDLGNAYSQMYFFID